MKHVVSISDLSKKQILSVLKRAKELVPVAKGKKKNFLISKNSIESRRILCTYTKPISTFQTKENKT